jgi:hypothetical protein
LSRRIAILRAISSDDKTLKSVTRFISPPPAPAGCGCRPGTKYRLLSDPGEDKIFPDLAHPAIAALLFAQACLSLGFARRTLR